MSSSIVVYDSVFLSYSCFFAFHSFRARCLLRSICSVWNHSLKSRDLYHQQYRRMKLEYQRFVDYDRYRFRCDESVSVYESNGNRFSVHIFSVFSSMEMRNHDEFQSLRQFISPDRTRLVCSIDGFTHLSDVHLLYPNLLIYIQPWWFINVMHEYLHMSYTIRLPTSHLYELYIQLEQMMRHRYAMRRILHYNSYDWNTFEDCCYYQLHNLPSFNTFLAACPNLRYNPNRTWRRATEEELLSTDMLPLWDRFFCNQEPEEQTLTPTYTPTYTPTQHNTRFLLKQQQKPLQHHKHSLVYR
jgi:hypothetical protein